MPLTREELLLPPFTRPDRRCIKPRRAAATTTTTTTTNTTTPYVDSASRMAGLTRSHAVFTYSELCQREAAILTPHITESRKLTRAVDTVSRHECR